MIFRKAVEGEVDYNDGEFAEVKTIGIEGIEKDLWLGTIQIHREDTQDTQEQFRQRFPIGMSIEIVTRTEITPIITVDEGLNEVKCLTKEFQ
jgi:hypothetical protein